MNQKSAEEISIQGQQLKQEGKLQQAIYCYQQAIELNPSNYDFYYKLGRIFQEQGEIVNASIYYREAIKINPHYSWSYHSLGEILAKQGKLEEAINCYYQAIELNPDFFWSHYNLGQIFQQQQQLDKAINYYQQAIKLNSQYSWSYHSLAEVLAQQNRFQEAIIYYRQAIELNPEFPNSHYQLGRHLQQQGQLEEAISCYRQFINLEPKHFWSYYYLGETLTKKNRLEEAIFYYRKGIELNPNIPDFYYQLGRIYQQQGQLKKAIDSYRQTLKIEPKHFWSYYYLGETLSQTYQFTEAIDCYQQAIELNPKAIRSCFNLGKILLQQGQEVIDKYRKSIEGKSNVFKAYIEIGLGQAWEQQSQFQKTINCYQKAIEFSPRLELPYKLLHYVPVKSEQLDDLIQFYKKMIEIVPDFALAWGNLGDNLTQKDRLDEAISCYRNSCYYNTIASHPNLAEFDWSTKKSQEPDFIIIGMAKCGTSSLFQYLREHPQILLPHKKEINFFNNNFNRGVDWYLAHFPAITDREDFLTGEASPYYLSTPEVDRRIFQLFPNVKLIILLRNPVERTISEYYHSFNRGLQKKSLLEIINSEKEYLARVSETESIYEFGYLLNSIYVDRIQRWMSIFPQENILILESKLFFERTDIYMKKIFDFLGLPHHTSSFYHKYNTGYYDSVSHDIKRILTEFFEPYNQRLEEYLDRNFNW
jgi:tetratricopeptide (TPR) repeat protein